MNQDITSRPIKLLMLVSAICLLVFLYRFTSTTLVYLDEADKAVTSDDQFNKVKKHNSILPQAIEAQLDQTNGDSP